MPQGVVLILLGLSQPCILSSHKFQHKFIDWGKSAEIKSLFS